MRYRRGRTRPARAAVAGALDPLTFIKATLLRYRCADGATNLENSSGRDKDYYGHIRLQHTHWERSNANVSRAVRRYANVRNNNTFPTVNKDKVLPFPNAFIVSVLVQQHIS